MFAGLPRLRHLLLVGLVAVLGIGACGDDDAEQADTSAADQDAIEEPGALDVCALLTAERAEALFGVAATEVPVAEPPESAETVRLGGCAHQYRSPDGLDILLVQLLVHDGTRVFGRTLFDEVEPVAVGDEGFVTEGLDTVVRWIDDDRTFSLTLTGRVRASEDALGVAPSGPIDPRGQREALVELAEAIAAET